MLDQLGSGIWWSKINFIIINKQNKMALKIRLSRQVQKKACIQSCSCDSRSPRDGRFIEKVDCTIHFTKR